MTLDFLEAVAIALGPDERAAYVGGHGTGQRGGAPDWADLAPQTLLCNCRSHRPRGISDYSRRLVRKQFLPYGRLLRKSRRAVLQR
jgi:hypothetical protein